MPDNVGQQRDIFWPMRVFMIYDIQEAQRSLGKADRTDYFRSLASDFRSWKKSDYPELTVVNAALKRYNQR